VRYLLTMMVGLFVITVGVEPVFSREILKKAQSQSFNVQEDTTMEVHKKKSPTGAMFRSLAIPGWGQFYNEQYVKSALVFAGETTLIALSFYYNSQAGSRESGSVDEAYYKDRRNLMYWLLGAVVLLSMLDAYIDAHLYDFDAGPDLSMRIGTLDIPTGQQIGLSIRAGF